MVDVAPAPEVTEAPAVPAAPAPAAWVTSLDHRRLGLAYLVSAFAFLVLGGVVALVLRVELWSPGLQILDRGHGDQLFTLHATVMVFLFLAPAWVGVACCLVPGMIGADRLAFPRLQALAFWLYLTGGVLVAVSYLVRGGPFAAGALLRFEQLRGATAGDASRLWILGMGTVSVAAVLAAVDLVTTVVQLRTPGTDLLRVPAFAWATVVSGVVVLLAVPVFVAGLTVLYIDVAHGGRIFTGRGGPVLWQHAVWLYGRPEVYGALLVPALGAVIDIVHPGLHREERPEARGGAALLTLAGVLSFTVWAAKASGRGAAVVPTFTPVAVLALVPAGLVVLYLVGGLRTLRPRPTAAVALCVGFALLLGLEALSAIVGAALHVHAGTEWGSAHAHYALFLAPLFALFAACFHWGPELFGRRLSQGLGHLQNLLLLAGVLLAFVPLSTGLRNQPRLTGDYVAHGGWTALNRVATVGAFVLALALVVFAAAVARSHRADVGDVRATEEFTG